MLIEPFSQQMASVSEWSVEPVQFGKFLTGVFGQWLLADFGRIFVQIFDVALESWANVPQSLCVFAPDCGSALAVEHNGHLYSCDHFVYPENRLGNIMERSLGSLVAVAAAVALR